MSVGYCVNLKPVISIFMLFYCKEIHWAGNAMRRKFASCFSLICLKSKCLQSKCFKIIAVLQNTNLNCKLHGLKKKTKHIAFFKNIKFPDFSL